MKRNYLQMYFNYTSLLKKIADEGDGVSVSPLFIYPERFGIDSYSEKLLHSYLKKRLNFFDGSTGESGNEHIISLIEALDMNYPNKAYLIELLKEVRDEAGSDQYIIEPLNLLINAIAESTERAEQIPHNFVSYATTSLTYPYFAFGIPYEVQKIYNNRQFAFNIAKDKKFAPAEKINIDTSKFEGKNEGELVSLFESKNFYKLNNEEIRGLMQSLANNYLASQNVSPCAVVFEPLEYSDSKITYGEYDPNRGAIIINSNVLDNFDSAKATKDQAFAYQLMSTIVHEARHRVQFSTFDISSSNLSEKQLLVKKALESPQEDMSYSQYLSSLDEIDARNAALEFMARNAEANSSASLMEFYNKKKRKEQHNQKAEIDPRLKKYFQDVYNNNYFDLTNEEMNELNKTLKPSNY